MDMSSKKRMRKCHDGKKAYPTLQVAQVAAASLAQRMAKQGSPVVTFLRAYGCACGQFHFGSTKTIDWSKVR